MADNPQQKQPGRGAGKPFQPGRSGNPAGKPKGARARSTIFGEAIMQADADDIVRAVVAAAKGGDPTAMRLCIERLIPVRKGRPVTFSLPALKTPDDVGTALAVIASAMASGELTPDEATAVAGVVELRRRALETTELEKRIAALEGGKQP